MIVFESTPKLLATFPVFITQFVFRSFSGGLRDKLLKYRNFLKYTTILRFQSTRNRLRFVREIIATQCLEKSASDRHACGLPSVRSYSEPDNREEINRPIRKPACVDMTGGTRLTQ